MLSNADNSNIEINVGKGGNGMSKGTISIGISEYKQILELAYKAAMLKEAVLNSATLSLYDKELYFGSVSSDVATIFKYAFPEDYENKLSELMDKKKANEAEQMEPTTMVKEVSE